MPLYSLAVTPGLVLPPSDSKGKAVSRGVKSRSAPGPTSKSFRLSTERREEEVGSGDKAECGSPTHTEYVGRSTVGERGFSQSRGIQGTSKMPKGPAEPARRGGSQQQQVGSLPCSSQELDQDKPSGAFLGGGFDTGLV